MRMRIIGFIFVLTYYVNQEILVNVLQVELKHVDHVELLLFLKINFADLIRQLDLENAIR